MRCRTCSRWWRTKSRRGTLRPTSSRAWWHAKFLCKGAQMAAQTLELYSQCQPAQGQQDNADNRLAVADPTLFKLAVGNLEGYFSPYTYSSSSSSTITLSVSYATLWPVCAALQWRVRCHDWFALSFFFRFQVAVKLNIYAKELCMPDT